jgi:hypothetical protein
VNPSARIKLIRDQMMFGERYTASTLYVIYEDIMGSCDDLIAMPLCRFETIRDQLRRESKFEGSWLGCDDGIYFKIEPLPLLTRLHDFIIKGFKYVSSRYNR